MPGPSVFPSGEPGVSGDFWVIFLSREGRDLGVAFQAPPGLTKKLEKESLSCSGPVGQDLPRQRTERLFEVVALHSSR